MPVFRCKLSSCSSNFYSLCCILKVLSTHFAKHQSRTYHRNRSRRWVHTLQTQTLKLTLYQGGQHLPQVQKLYSSFLTWSPESKALHFQIPFLSLWGRLWQTQAGWPTLAKVMQELREGSERWRVLNATTWPSRLLRLN